MQGILSGLRPAVIAMIASAGISLIILSAYGQRTLPANLYHINYASLLIFLTCLFILRKWKTNPIYVMVGAGITGILLYSVF